MAIQDLINQNTTEVTNYRNAIAAIEAGLRFKIHEQVMIASAGTAPVPGQLPNYKVIATDPALKGRIETLVNEAYSVDNTFHPFKGVVNSTALAGNYFNEAMFNSLLFGHKSAIIEAVRTATSDGPDFMTTYNQLSMGSEQHLVQMLLGMAGSRIASESNLADLQGFIKTNHAGVNPNLVDTIAEPMGFARAYGMLVGQNAGYVERKDEILEAALKPKEQHN